MESIVEKTSTPCFARRRRRRRRTPAPEPAPSRSTTAATTPAASPAAARGRASPTTTSRRSLCRMCKADESYWAYRVDGQCQCVKTTGAGHTDCLEKGTCAPDPTCAPTIDVAGTTSTKALEGYAWVAKD